MGVRRQAIEKYSPKDTRQKPPYKSNMTDVSAMSATDCVLAMDAERIRARPAGVTHTRWPAPDRGCWRAVMERDQQAQHSTQKQKKKKKVDSLFLIISLHSKWFKLYPQQQLLRRLLRRRLVVSQRDSLNSYTPIHADKIRENLIFPPTRFENTNI